ncbi:MAG: hypothetical protein KAR42_14710 [candidate division Zixibacteria bacterium]|nr:hypothetical protein [candidate division Zixibacteria bacterium]
MSNRPSHCQAHDDHGSGTIVCNRCGYQWDADDAEDVPPCKTWDEINKERKEQREAYRVIKKQVGRDAIKHLKKILPPPDER